MSLDEIDQVLSFDNIPNFKTFDGISKRKPHARVGQRGENKQLMSSMGLDGADRQKSPDLGNDRRPVRVRNADD